MPPTHEPLELPSGFVAEVVRPSVRSLLSGLSLAEAALATPDLSEADLSEADRLALEMWAADALADDAEAEAFVQVCAVFGARPSRELGIADGLLAFRLDNALVGVIPRTKGQR